MYRLTCERTKISTRTVRRVYGQTVTFSVNTIKGSGSQIVDIDESRSSGTRCLPEISSDAHTVRARGLMGYLILKSNTRSLICNGFNICLWCIGTMDQTSKFFLVGTNRGATRRMVNARSELDSGTMLFGLSGPPMTFLSLRIQQFARSKIVPPEIVASTDNAWTTRSLMVYPVRWRLIQERKPKKSKIDWLCSWKRALQLTRN